MSILVADDHALMREAVQRLLATEWPFVRIDTASTYQEVWAALSASTASMTTASATIASPYQLIILDLRMPGISGIPDLFLLLQQAAPTPVIIYTGVESKETNQQLLRQGVYRVVAKTGEIATLLQTVREIMDGVAQPKTVNQGSDIQFPESQFNPQVRGLSVRQIEILRYLHQGLPNKVIAQQMEVAIGTVKNHLHALYERLDVTSRSEAISKTREWFL